MRALKIDVEKKSVEEVEVNGLIDLQKAVDGYICQATRFPLHDILYVDDEGLLKTPKLFFSVFVSDFPAPRVFAGNGILVGGTEEGDSAPCKLSLDVLKEITSFYTLEEVREGTKNNTLM